MNEEEVKDPKRSKPLANRRHEAFAQACAVGMSASDAYRATYGSNSKHVDSLSARLSASVKVRARIYEIQAQAEHVTHMTIAEKRSHLAKISRDARNKDSDRIKAMIADSELAGHLAHRGGLEVNVNVAVMDEGRRAELMAKKRAAVQRRLQNRQTGHSLNGANGSGHN